MLAGRETGLMKLAMIGLGTVGAGVAQVLTDRPERFEALGVAAPRLKWVAVRDASKPRPAAPPNAVVTTRLEDLLDDPQVEVVIEVAGGVGPARDAIARALRAGKHVVTANKAVLAEHGLELFQIAKECDRAILFEASVAGGIPILSAVAETLAVNRIQSVSGILNGTCNYILTAMHETGLAYEDALSQAQKLGFAESDPTLDVSGADAAQKLAILARLAFQSRVDWQTIRVRGIDQLASADIAYAQELGYVVKLLAEGRVLDGKLHLHVSPTLVHRRHPLAQVRGEYNAVQVMGDAVGDLFFSGKGAGMMPTASSVAAGVIDLATGRGQKTFRALGLWQSSPPGPEFASEAYLRSRFYLRFAIRDRPGTLAAIAGVLGEHSISIASVIQHEVPEAAHGSYVPLIIMTHEASEGSVREALVSADRLEIVHGPSICLPVTEN